MVFRESHRDLSSLSLSSHPFSASMSHGATVLHLHQLSSLQSGVRKPQEQPPAGMAVMMALETKVMQSVLEMEFHIINAVNSDILGKMCFFYVVK